MSDTEYNRTLKQVGKDAPGAVDHVAAAMSDIGHKVREATTDAGTAFRDASRKAGTVASDVGSDVYHRGQRIGRDVAEHVETQPLSSVVIAAVAGLFAGLLLARR